jgi:hypothetical protein
VAEGLVDEGGSLDEMAADARHDGTDRSFLVPGGNADHDPRAPLGGDEIADRPLGVVVGGDRRGGLKDCHLQLDKRG